MRRPQIKFVLLLSRQGKVRLSKWYTTLTQKERAKIIREITPMVLARPLKLCNFLDWKDNKVRRDPVLVPMLAWSLPYRRAWPLCAFVDESCTAPRAGGSAGKPPAVLAFSCFDTPSHVLRHGMPGAQLVYKRYASLYFVAGIEEGDNELITLEVIHHFVEVR